MTLNALGGPTEIDTSVFDHFTATSGIFTASSINGDPLTFGISGGTVGSTVLNGVNYNLSQVSPYGTLYLNSATGAYAFVPNSDAINALQAPTTDSFTITVSDGNLSAQQTFTIAIDGANDAAIISGVTTGGTIEAGGAANAIAGMPTVTGMLTDTDVDNPPNTFTAVSSPKASTGGYGTFTITSAGVWTYTLNNANSTVQALNVGDKLTDTFTVTTIDGTPEVVTITINGVNDAAVISGTTTGCVIEAGCWKPGTPTATGTLTDTDVDNPPNTFTAVSSPKASTGGYGTFTMTSAGVWTYTLNNANSTVQALNVGDKLTDTFTVITIDGTPQVVTSTINGTNDPAVISGTTTGCVVAADCDEHGTPIAKGTLTDTDVDNPSNTFTAVCAPKASAGGYGTFTMTAAGVWTYTLDDNNCAVRALDDDDTLTDTFTVTTIDGTPQVVTITIHGGRDDDRHDSDHLASAPQVASDPPQASGTPDTTAGAGDGSPVVQATAVADTHATPPASTVNSDPAHGTASNDAISANDTIGGAPGQGAIGGKVGHDTIVVGDGAGHLAAGHGDDCFVYLPVAEPRAARFDAIDFKSGTDRIDLTAFGALAFVILALDATSTSVPAHTIAWLYDSAANQTIVYVNPTDQTLSIGASGLLEIHLQGIAAVEPSDFVLAPTTAVLAATESADPGSAATAENDATAVAMTAAHASSKATVTDHMLLADENRAGQATKPGPSLDADHDRIELFDSARLTSDDNVRMHTAQYSDEDAAMTSVSEQQSIKLQHVHQTAPTETTFVSNQTPASDNAAPMTVANGAVTDPGPAVKKVDVAAPSSAADDGTGPQVDRHSSALPGDDGIGPPHNDSKIDFETKLGSNHEDHNHEDLRALIAKVDGAINAADAGSHSIWGEAGEHGTPLNYGADGFYFVPSTATHVASSSTAAGGLGHEDSFHFRDEIPGSERSGVIGHALANDIGTSIDNRDNAGETHGRGTMSEDAQAAELSLPTYHPHDDVLDQAKSAVITHVSHDLMV